MKEIKEEINVKEKKLYKKYKFARNVLQLFINWCIILRNTNLFLYFNPNNESENLKSCRMIN